MEGDGNESLGVTTRFGEGPGGPDVCSLLAAQENRAFPWYFSWAMAWTKEDGVTLFLQNIYFNKYLLRLGTLNLEVDWFVHFSS